MGARVLRRGLRLLGELLPRGAREGGRRGLQRRRVRRVLRHVRGRAQAHERPPFGQRVLPGCGPRTGGSCRPSCSGVELYDASASDSTQRQGQAVSEGQGTRPAPQGQGQGPELLHQSGDSRARAPLPRPGRRRVSGAESPAIGLGTARNPLAAPNALARMATTWP